MCTSNVQKQKSKKNGFSTYNNSMDFFSSINTCIIIVRIKEIDFSPIFENTKIIFNLLKIINEPKVNKSAI